MKPSRLLVLSVIALSLAACGPSESSVSSSVSSSSGSDSSSSGESSLIIDDVPFVHKKMPAVLRLPDNIEMVDAYFRLDGMKNIPYLKLSDYYHCLLNKSLQEIQVTSPGVYVISSASGGVATFDTVEDTFHSLDMEQFINTTIFRQANAKNVYYDGSPFIRVKDVNVDVGPSPKSIQLKKDYAIDLFAFDQDVLVPITFASNLFQGPTMLTCFYTKEKLYFIDPNDEGHGPVTYINSEEYIDGLDGFFENGKRSPEQARYSYGQLCFFIDNYYGRPGRERLHATLEEQGSLDKALSVYDDYTRQAQAWLKSTDQIEYYAGMAILDDYISDTGHTVSRFGDFLYLRNRPELEDAMTQKLASIGYTLKQNAPKRIGMDREYSSAIRQARMAKGIDDLSVIIEGDTLLFTFDEFTFNLKTWQDYYSGKRDTLPKDPIGTFKNVLERYKDGGTIKNVVVDISNNGGGFADVVFMLMAMMGKGGYMNYFDFINKNNVHVTYDADLNFDGRFDEEDAKVKYPYNFGILTSGVSFSCGNVLPMQAKESGIMILGDTTGGGACAVLDGIRAEGYYTRISSHVHIMTADGHNTDFGVEPHRSLCTKTAKGYDLSKFYDLSVIKQYMDEFYAEK